MYVSPRPRSMYQASTFLEHPNDQTTSKRARENNTHRAEVLREGMASATGPTRSTRPLPTGWSDSSGDDLNAKGGRAMSVDGAGAAAGGGGFDTDSSDEGWCGRGGGLRDFERSSAETTRRALLRNDARLCEPPPLPPSENEQQQQQQQQPQLQSDSALSDGSGEGRGEQQQQRRQPPLRFVPGDPFAKEEADVGAWARHFTYLEVVPSGTIFSKTLEPPRSAEREGGAEVEAGISSRFGEKGGAAAVAVPVAARREATLLSTVAAVAAAAADEEEEEEEGNGRRQERQGGEEEELEKEGEEEEEGEVVYASHGVYEEYLAYDCRPPGSDEIEDSQCLAAGEGAGGATTTAAAAAAAAARAGQGRWPNTTQEGDGGASRPRLGTPQRELRQEIMDRLFDEVWEHLTPDLVLLLELDASAGAGGGGGAGRPGEGQHPEFLVGGGGGGGGGGSGAGTSVPVVGGGSGGFATGFGRDVDDGFRRDSMEH